MSLPPFERWLNLGRDDVVQVGLLLTIVLSLVIGALVFAIITIGAQSIGLAIGRWLV